MTTHHKLLMPFFVVLLLTLIFSALALFDADRRIDRLEAQIQQLEQQR